jgi:DNA-binding NarL/FixJ family response regulator
MSTLEIAARLELTREDVAEHVVSVMRALGARSKLEAIVRAHHHGLLPFQDA